MTTTTPATVPAPAETAKPTTAVAAPAEANETPNLPAINEDGTINDPAFKAHILPKWYQALNRVIESGDVDDKIACETFGDILANTGSFQYRGKTHDALSVIEEVTGEKIPTTAALTAKRPATFDLVVERASQQAEWRTMTKEQRNDFVYELAEKAGLLEQIQTEMAEAEEAAKATTLNESKANNGSEPGEVKVPEFMQKINEVTDRMGENFTALTEDQQNIVRVKVSKRIGCFEDLNDWINSENDEAVKQIEQEVQDQEVSEEPAEFGTDDGAAADDMAAMPDDVPAMDGDADAMPADADMGGDGDVQAQIADINVKLDDLLAKFEQALGDGEEALVTTGAEDGDASDSDDDKDDSDDDDDDKADESSAGAPGIQPAVNPNPEAVPESAQKALGALTEEEIKTMLMKVKDPKKGLLDDGGKSPTPSASFTAVPEVDAKKSPVGKVSGGVEKGGKASMPKDMGCTTRPDFKKVKVTKPMEPAPDKGKSVVTKRVGKTTV